ncbi:MAG: C40 family peptidase [Burkholderiaceae bacterium]
MQAAVARNRLRRLSIPGPRALTFLCLALLLGACAGPPPSNDAVREARFKWDHGVAASQTGNEIALMAISMIGKPYVWGGQNPRKGFDCSGLVRHVVIEAAGVDLPRTAAQMARHGKSISRAALRPGDLVFFTTSRRRNSHVGIYVGQGRFVHAPAAGKMIRLAELDNPYWQRVYSQSRRAIP